MLCFHKHSYTLLVLVTLLTTDNHLLVDFTYLQLCVYVTAKNSELLHKVE